MKCVEIDFVLFKWLFTWLRFEEVARLVLKRGKLYNLRYVKSRNSSGLFMLPKNEILCVVLSHEYTETQQNNQLLLNLFIPAPPFVL